MNLRRFAVLSLIAASLYDVFGAEPLVIPSAQQSVCEEEEIIIINRSGAPAKKSESESPLRQNALDPFRAAPQMPAAVVPAQQSQKAAHRQAGNARPRPPYTDKPVHFATHNHRRKQIPWDTKVHFSWGVDAGASIDMVGNNRSAINVNATFGLRRGWINFFGVGAGTMISITDSSRAYPLFAEFRTNFRDRPSLCFLDIRGGVAYNLLSNEKEQFGTFAFVGAGINLARSAKFTSFIMLGYTYRERRNINEGEIVFNTKDMHYATCRLGITF
ncbi:MAG: hypothetical protein J6J93_03270 [Muribaculaceae bacterium]|nr:hypothetical protein [Muribaculaceae bacterium]